MAAIASRPRGVSVLAIAALAVNFVGIAAVARHDGSHPAPTASSPAVTSSTTTTTVLVYPNDTSFVASAKASSLDVFDQPGEPTPRTTFSNPQASGARLVFLIQGSAPSDKWLQVLLPIRPNGSTGWVRSSDVTVTHHSFRIRIEIAAHRLTLTKSGDVVIDTPVGVGTVDTPTPGGTYYLAELLQPPDPSGPYGPYAFGLSGFSDVLRSFNGGDGVIGIHGTNDPSSIGRDVSHGCIRVENDVISEMAALLPLGTPVEIAP